MVYVMYPQKGAGFANTLIHLCDFFNTHPDGVVHESIKEYELGRWLTFHFPLTDRTDLPVYEPKIYINQYTIHQVHPLVRKLISPSPELQQVIDEHLHLVNGVQLGLHIRRGASAKDSRIVVWADSEVFADDQAVNTFRKISNGKTLFLASDSPDTKKLFPEARTLDTTIAVLHDRCPDAPVNDRRNVFLDFFLLSRCPQLYITAGNFPNLPGLSTFGYMAAIYGNVPFEAISNA
jgi:hypothetical protein